MIPAVRCQCGKRFQPKPQLAGTYVACPNCRQPIRIPNDDGVGFSVTPESNSSLSDSSLLREAAASEPDLKIVCVCGKRFAASARLAGRVVRCPACDGVLSVPRKARAVAAPGGSPPPRLRDQWGLDPLGENLGVQTLRRDTTPHTSASDRTLLTATAVVTGGVVIVLLALVAWSAVMSAIRSSPTGMARVSQQAAPVPNTLEAPANVGSDVLPFFSAGTGSPNQPSAAVETRTSSVARESITDDRYFGSYYDSAAGVAALAEAFDPEPVVGSSLLGSATPALPSGTQKWWQSSRRVPTAPADEEHLMLRHSWMCELLPYLGYESLYQQLDFSTSWTDAGQIQAAATVIPQFLNPADPQETWSGYPYEGLAVTHFVGVSGVEDSRTIVAATLPRTDPRAGIFGYDEIARPEDIADGTSQTLMMIGNGQLKAPWVQAGGATIRGAREPHFDALSGFGSEGLQTPGAIAIFADGSVREISATVDPAVFRAMCTIRGNESVQARDGNGGRRREHRPLFRR